MLSVKHNTGRRQSCCLCQAQAAHTRHSICWERKTRREKGRRGEWNKDVAIRSGWGDKAVWKGEKTEKVVGWNEGEMGCRGGSVEQWRVREVTAWTLTQILNMVSDNLIWLCCCVVFLSFHSLWMHDDHTPLLSALCAVTWRLRAR